MNSQAETTATPETLNPQPELPEVIKGGVVIPPSYLVYERRRAAQAAAAAESVLDEEDGSDGYPSLTPLDRRFSRTTTPIGSAPDKRGAARVAAANQAPRCIHVKTSGLRCHAPALRGEDYCYFHRRLHVGPRLIYPSLSRLEDAHGIQAALMEVLIGTLDGRIDGKTAGRLLYGLQTAASNLRHMPELDDEDIVTEIPQPHAPDTVSDPQADAAAEKAAASAGAAAALDHLREHHVVPGRSSGDSAQDGRFAEMMAGYYDHDPDVPPDPAVGNHSAGEGARATQVHESAKSLVNSTQWQFSSAGNP